MKKSVICGFVRSPFTPANKGELVKTRPDDLLANTINGLLAKTAIAPQDIEDIKVGCAFPEGEQGFNIGRMVNFIAGLPQNVCGMTINRFCGSSMQAIADAAGAIATNGGDVFVCAGIESMTRIPMGGISPAPNADLYDEYAGAYIGMGETAENVASRYKISREEQDEFAVLSHQRATDATEAGKYKDEIIPFGDIAKDGCIRPGTKAEKLATLKPVFDENGVVTAATSSPLTDGASAVLVCSEEYADKNALQKLAYVESFAVAGCDPEYMGLGPIWATKKALQRANLTIDDIDIIELNEAFASQSIACIRDLNIDINKVNIDGGALAIGHPLGATGARITGKVAQLLVREDKKLGLATQCIGGGMGIAMILRRA